MNSIRTDLQLLSALSAAEPLPPTVGPSWRLLGWVAAAIVLAVLVIGFACRYLPRILKRMQDSPRRIYRTLCRAHKLSWSHRRLLLKLARSSGLPPQSLFLQPETLESALRDPNWQHATAHISALQAKLFGN